MRVPNGIPLGGSRLIQFGTVNCVKTLKGFNYPHQIASYYGMYRVARNHDKMEAVKSWEFYLERAALTVLHMGCNRIGYMDGTVQREVLRSVIEEDAAAGPNSTWAGLVAKMTACQKSRADYWSTAKYPYGSEFAYVQGSHSIRRHFYLCSRSPSVMLYIVLSTYCNSRWCKDSRPAYG
jgi:hypothetical protein